mmetsp:Transcript_15693/g.15676  ORF Transcript_15693/g.15676 Transcript_15693/m.15676 type:complete len:122 (+) Transcript_15693:643-1008(+)
MNFTTKIEEEKESKDEIKNIKRIRSQIFLELILQKQVNNNSETEDKYEFFAKSKYLISFYVKFYMEKAKKIFDDEEAMSSYINEAMSILDWYWNNKKRRNIGFIITESELSNYLKILPEKI